MVEGGSRPRPRRHPDPGGHELVPQGLPVSLRVDPQSYIGSDLLATRELSLPHMDRLHGGCQPW